MSSNFAEVKQLPRSQIQNLNERISSLEVELAEHSRTFNSAKTSRPKLPVANREDFKILEEDLKDDKKRDWMV